MDVLYKKNDSFEKRVHPPNLKYLKIIVSIFFILGVLISAFFAQLKITSVNLHEKNYGFFAQFSSKLLDPQTTNQYSFQPEGHNVLGLVGVEGEYSFYQSIHLEPIKYVYPVIYTIFKTPSVIFVFIALIFYSPVLYLLNSHPFKDRKNFIFVACIAAIYIFYPSAVHAITQDLRPRSLLGATFALSFLSIHYQRSNWQKLLFFGCMFFIREEALVFGMMLILYNFLGTENRKDRLITSVFLSAIWIAAALITYFYFSWTGYKLDRVYKPLSLISVNSVYFVPAIIVGLIIIILVSRIWKERSKKESNRLLFQLSVFGMLLIPLSIQLKMEFEKWSIEPGDFFSITVPNLLLKPNINLFVIVFLMFIVFIWSVINERTRKKVIPGLVIAAIFFIGYNIFSIHNRATLYRGEAELATILFETREKTSYLETSVMTDYKTFQVFYDYENLYVFNRLPSHIIEIKEERYFPENIEVVGKLMMEEVEYIVISRESVLDIQNLINEYQITILETIENNSYKIFRIR